MEILWEELQSCQTSSHKIAQIFIKKVTKANFLAERWHLETLTLHLSMGEENTVFYECKELLSEGKMRFFLLSILLFTYR